MNQPAPIATLSGVTKIYGSGETQVNALEDADLSVYPGEILLIEGPSGSGKTTLISILGLLLRPTRGDVFVRGERVTALPQRALPPIRAGTFGFIFQGFNLFPALTAEENVAIAIKMKDPRARNANAEARRLLASVGLENRMHHKPGDLSGGQKQRVAIARALFNEPELLLCDEPTGNLDSATGHEVIEFFKELNQKDGVTLMIVTHERRMSTIAQRVITMRDGAIVEGDQAGGEDGGPS